jgi:hypothetical protein
MEKYQLITAEILEPIKLSSKFFPGIKNTLDSGVVVTRANKREGAK